MLDRQLAVAARRHHGILTPDLIDQLGITEYDLKVRLRSGVLERRHDKVLVVAGAPRTWTQHVAVAVLALPDSVAGHESSARMLRFYGFDQHEVVSVLAPLAAHQRLSGVRVRRTGYLPPEHIATTSGIRHTSRPRTLIDLATVVGDARLQRIIEDELAADRVAWDELERTFRSLCGRGRPGIARARRVLEEIEGRPPTESKLERMYLDLLIKAGVPLPTMQVTAPWADREPGRVDGMWIDARSIVELDGRKFHQRNEAFERDRRRDQLATINEHVTNRFTYKQITGDPDHVIAVSRFLASRRP